MAVAVLGFILPAGGAFGALAGGISVFGIALSTAAGGLTVAGTLLNAASSLAISAALAPNLPSAGPVSTSISVNLAQEKADRIGHYGRVFVGGTLGFAGAKSGVLSRVVIHGHGEVDAIEVYYIDGTEMFIDGSGFITNSQFLIGAKNYLRVISRSGVVPSTYYSELEADFTEWDDSHRLDGLCTTLLQAELPGLDKFNAMYPNREPNLKVLLRGSRVYDPRSMTTAWTSNLALCVRDFLTSRDGFDVESESIDDSFFITAADISDVDRPLLEGGTQKQFEFHGSYSLNEPKIDVLKRMTGTGAADIFLTGEGKIGIEMGTWYEPEFTLTDEMVFDFEYDTGPDIIDGFNTLLLKFVDPDAQYSVVDAKPWLNDERLLIEGEQTQEAYVHCHSHAQTRAVGKTLSGRLNPKSVLRVRCKPMAITGYFDTRWKVSLTINGIMGTFVVKEKSLNPNTLVSSYTLHEIQEEAYTLSLDEQLVKPVSATVTDNTGIPVAVGFGAVGHAGGIGAAWEPNTNASLSPRLEYSPVGQDTWQAVTVSDGSTFAQIDGVTVGQDYDVRFAWVTAGNTVGEYVTVSYVTATNDTGAPNDPTGFTITDVGNESIRFNITSSSSADNWRTEIYRNDNLIHTEYSGPGYAVAITQSVGTGTHTYTALAKNIANEVSTTISSTPISITISGGA
jgi:hypothetical protein